MASAAQITANRINAQSCTGPKTEAGKARSSQNALKHGLFCARVVLPHESQEEYDQLLAELTGHHAPVSIQEIAMVREVANNYWKLERARRIEAHLLENLVQSDDDLANCMTSDAFPELDRIARVISRAEAAWYRSMSHLDRLLSARKREPLRAAREAAAEAREKAAEAKRAAAESRRKSEVMIQELLLPSEYREELGFVPREVPSPAPEPTVYEP